NTPRKNCPLKHYFYPRSPRGERPVLCSTSLTYLLFLSTLPARGATSCRRPFRRPPGFLSTLPARGATGVLVLHWVPELISIHAPREGSDLRQAIAIQHILDFYPRSPRGERQSAFGLAASADII